VSLTSARLIIIINSNLGISPPEGTSRLHRGGRAHGGEANVVKAGCSWSGMELKAGCGGTPQRRLLAASLLLLEYRFTDFLVRARCIAALTAPFICRMQIECNRCCGARHQLSRGNESRYADCGQNNTRRPSHRPNYTCAYGRLRFCRPLKKKSAGTSHATHKLVNFSFLRGLKEIMSASLYLIYNCFVSTMIKKWINVKEK